MRATGEAMLSLSILLQHVLKASAFKRMYSSACVIRGNNFVTLDRNLLSSCVYGCILVKADMALLNEHTFINR
jgi:hypothetical protein